MVSWNRSVVSCCFRKSYFFDTRHQSANVTKGNVRFALCGLSVWISDAVTASTLSMNYLSRSRESACNGWNLNTRRPRLYSDTLFFWNVHSNIWLEGVSLHWRAPKIISRDVPWILISSINSVEIIWVLHHQHDLISNTNVFAALWRVSPVLKTWRSDCSENYCKVSKSLTFVCVTFPDKWFRL